MNMKVFNRLALIIALYAIALTLCVIKLSDPYLCGMIVYCGFIAAIMSCGYVLEKNDVKTI